MSETHDAMKQVRIDPENYAKLIALKKKLPGKFPIGSLANMALIKGIPIVAKELSR